MSEMKMENSRVPAEKIFNPDLKEAIVNMQEDNSKENVDKMITEVVKAIAKESWNRIKISVKMPDGSNFINLGKAKFSQLMKKHFGIDI